VSAKNLQLEGHTALVTGSSRNVGRAIALALAREGANVVAHGLTNPEGAEETAQAARGLGVRALVVMGDVGDQQQVRTMVRSAIDELGPIDILVNAPGLRPTDDTLAMTPAIWHRVLATNLDGPFYCAQAVLPGMIERGWGRIVNISGGGAFVGEAGQAHVTASKAGLLGLTRALAREFAKSGVLVNTISPGLLHTADSPYRKPGRDYEEIESRMLTGHLIEVSEIAAMCVYLCDPAQRSITGQTLHINAGALFT
jgi:NAD(P)-dependent dehydrogenase (short-subunit alcohol dehydrogenase family)